MTGIRFDHMRLARDVHDILRRGPHGIGTTLVRETGISTHTLYRMRRHGVKDVNAILKVTTHLGLDFDDYVLKGENHA